MSDGDSGKGGVFSRWFRRPPEAPAEPSGAPQQAPVNEPAPAEQPAPELIDEPVASTPPVPGGWLARLRGGLARTSGQLGRGISDLLTKSRLDAVTLDDLEDVLIQADLGVDTAQRITAEVGRQRLARNLDDAAVRGVVAGEIGAVLAPVAHPLEIAPAKPFVILMVGVNGSGKTTTIGKLAQRFGREGRSVMIAAGDTFRAAAVEQLAVWAGRAGAPLVRRETGADAAGVAFDALQQARTAGTDVLMIDTAGRLQNRAELMGELAKITRVIRKLEPAAPHAVLLVLDATVGQNALSQVEAFGDVAGVTGLVMTKLDGTARGGILVAVAARFGLPIHFIGVGEGDDDLAPFDAADFARALVDLT
jgi:fused signal recognition particle receptor